MTDLHGTKLTNDARWLVQALDPATDQVRLVRMSADEYRQASFLDDRLFQQQREALIAPWSQVAAAAGGPMREDARWIFHIGHVGSTLLSRLLGELPPVFAVREPRVLRDLATLDAARRGHMLPELRKLLSRTFAPTETALVKATSFVSEHAGELPGPDGRALMMYAGPRAYIETILAGPNSVLELRHLAGQREARSRDRIPTLHGARNDAELAALAWACEMTAMESAAEAIDVPVQWLDFDTFLKNVPEQLTAVAEGFGFDAPAGTVEEIATGPLLGRYSKDLAHGYSPALRAQLKADARAREHQAINDSMTILEEMAKGSPLLARALGRRARED